MRQGFYMVPISIETSVKSTSSGCCRGGNIIGSYYLEIRMAKKLHSV